MRSSLIILSAFLCTFLAFSNSKQIGQLATPGLNKVASVDIRIPKNKIDGFCIQTLDFKQIGNSILFLNRSDTSYYFVSLTSFMTMPPSVSLTSYTPGTLVIRNNSTTSLITYSTTSNANGISYLKGTRYDSTFLITIQGEIYLDDDPPIDLISCKCFPDADVENHDCDSGGEGSSGCEVTDGGETGPIGWNNHCAVDCKAGFFACCNES